MQDLTNSFSSSEDKYKQKYLKYKSKYDMLLNQNGGSSWWGKAEAGKPLEQLLPRGLGSTRSGDRLPTTSELEEKQRLERITAQQELGKKQEKERKALESKKAEKARQEAIAANYHRESDRMERERMERERREQLRRNQYSSSMEDLYNDTGIPYPQETNSWW
jgi:hypothetical protein